jgi:hypothetical protein
MSSWPQSSDLIVTSRGFDRGTPVWRRRSQDDRRRLDYVVEDDSDPGPRIEVQVFGDRGSATEHARLDASGTLSLRAERSVSGEARVYLVAITATDAAGNKGVGTCSVVVPGNNGTENPERSQERAAAAEAT